jgi:hypothetical protein
VNLQIRADRGIERQTGVDAAPAEIHSIGNRLTDLCGRILLDPLELQGQARAVLGAARDPHSGNDLVAEARSDCVALVLGDPEAPALIAECIGGIISREPSAGHRKKRLACA